METELHYQKSNTLSILNHLLYIFFITGLIFSFRAVSSISLGLILLTGLLANKSLSSILPGTAHKFFMGGCVLFLLLQFISLMYTGSHEEAWEQIRLKSGVVLTPLAVYCSRYLNSRTVKRLLFEFCLILALALLYALVVRLARYSDSGDPSVFYYHQLVSPLRQHAVYFSIFVFTGFVFLLESIRRNDVLVNRTIYIILAVYFSIFLFFLSSKLVIFFFMTYILYYFIRYFKTPGRLKIVLIILFSFILAGTLVLTTDNPVSKRFSELFKKNSRLVKQEPYTPADYFNGLQFRALQWKLVPEILNENKTWLKGVGSGDAQYYLDRKYVSKNMYTGDPLRKVPGFLGYNTHNQFLQALLQNGMIGLAVFMLICLGIVQMGWHKKNAFSFFIILLLVAYAFTESVFETQYGIIIFTFFPLLAYFSVPADPPGRKAVN